MHFTINRVIKKITEVLLKIPQRLLNNIIGTMLKNEDGEWQFLLRTTLVYGMVLINIKYLFSCIDCYLKISSIFEYS